MTSRQAQRNYIKAASKGIIKVMSKMGISTVASYTGAQVFEAVGLAAEVVDEYFTGTVSRIGGVGLDVLAEEVASRHRLSHLDRPTELAHREREVGGEYQWRREGEIHLFNPKTVFKLQHATRSKRYEVFKEYTRAVDEQSTHLATLRGMMHLRTGVLPAVPIDEVEPSAGHPGPVLHRGHVLRVDLRRGPRDPGHRHEPSRGRSNTGEGGEDSDRFTPDANGDLRRSAIKQVASGRFGVTSEYLVNSDDIQIKIAQGAKPGEGGQLAGTKVYPWIAKTRFSTPGVGLISPPPHHDIYSIEDIAQLIHDLKSANPRARVHVKLVAEVGVGTVAAGVAKAHSDVVLISGHDGGTGAAPLTSLKHAGIPWELGLAETQQTLLANDLRDRIVVQVDGQMKTGRDVVIGALLGAEEFGFATAPLVVSGCVMMRVCHLDTCPVGIATQNPTLRARYSGTPEFVETFFEYIAEEVREYLAALGLRSLEEAIGRVDLIDAARAIDHWKAAGLDLSPILVQPELPDGAVRYCINEQDHGLDRALDHAFLDACRPAIDSGTPVTAELAITNVNRTVGTLLGYEITRRHGGAGLPEGTIDLTFRGSAGQSFGAFVPKGVTMRLLGDANDYLGKGLSGGRIIVRPPEDAPFAGRGQHRGRQRDPLRGHRRRGVPARPGRRAVLCPQLRGHRRGRGRGRPRLRVHDRWAGGGARTDRAQPRSGHVGRHGLRLRPARIAGRHVQPRHRRPRSAVTGGPDVVEGPDHHAPGGNRLGRRRPHPGRLGQLLRAVRHRDAQGLPAGPRGHRAGHRRGPFGGRGGDGGGPWVT